MSYVTGSPSRFVLFLALLAVAGCNNSRDRNNAAAPPTAPPASPAPVASAAPQLARFASESGTIQISDDDRRVYVLNRGVEGRGSLSVIEVVDAAGADARTKLGEVRVGNFPESVSVAPVTSTAYVSNSADNTVSVLNLDTFELIDTITVGAEPRGTALSPSGQTLYVANFSDGSLSVIDTASGQVTATVDLSAQGRQVVNPHAVLVTNDGDGDDSDETIFVADFYARAIPGRGVDTIEGFDDGREGRLAAVSALNLVTESVLPLSPMASGFSADRTAFDTANGAVNDTFKSAALDPTQDPQDVLFNQLHTISSDGTTGRLYVNAIGAQPEPPVKFNLNVQALVGAVDGSARQEVAAEHVNLNNLIKVETQPAEPFNGTLERAFAGDTVDSAIRGGVVLMISRAGSYALRAYFDGSGKLELRNDASTPARRISTGSVPSGVVLSGDGRRGYVNAEVDQTVTAIDVTTHTAIGAAIPAAELPAPGTIEHNALLGKLVFFTGMGVPADGLVGKDVREIDTRLFRGMASDNNWSSCASCHTNGLSDNVTWIFPTGPRQTPALDASYSPSDPQIQRVFNWNAVRGSVTDFNNNSRNIQGGKGFTPGGDADAAQVFNHGPNFGVSDALDLETLWVQIGIRTPNAPTAADEALVRAGRDAFEALNCSGCHGGDQWTSSRVRWSYPLFASNPLAPGGATPLDARVLNAGTGPVIQAFDEQGDGFDDDVNGFFDTPVIARFDVAAAPASPTLNPANPIEIRGAGGLVGKGSVGGAGSFNPPALLGLASTAPYGHHGRAQTVGQVFADAGDGGLGHPTFGATTQQQAALEAFLLSIDGTTQPVD